MCTKRQLRVYLLVLVLLTLESENKVSDLVPNLDPIEAGHFWEYNRLIVSDMSKSSIT